MFSRFIIINIIKIIIVFIRLLHQSVLDLIDPTRLYLSPALQHTLIGSNKQLNINSKGKAKYYATSAPIKSIFSDSKIFNINRFLNRSNTVHVTLPGVVGIIIDYYYYYYYYY